MERRRIEDRPGRNRFEYLSNSSFVGKIAIETRFLVAFDVHFSNERVSFHSYMDFLQRMRAEEIGMDYFFLFLSPFHVDWNLIELGFMLCLTGTKGLKKLKIASERLVAEATKWSVVSEISLFEHISRDIED